MPSEQDKAWKEVPKTDDPKEFLESVMCHPGIAMADRIEAAKALLPFVHEPLASEDDEGEDDD